MAHKFGRRVTRLSIKRDIRQITRSFPTQYVRVKRQVERYDPNLGERVNAYDLIYEGTALVRPAGGSVETYGLGTVENFSLVVLISGRQAIRQGDVLTINDGREYEVAFPPVWFDAFTELRLATRSQIEQQRA